MESYVKHNRRFLWNPSYVIKADILSLLRSRLFLSPLSWVVPAVSGIVPYNTLEGVKWLPASDAHAAQGYVPVTRSRAEAYARPIVPPAHCTFFLRVPCLHCRISVPLFPLRRERMEAL